MNWSLTKTRLGTSAMALPEAGVLFGSWKASATDAGAISIRTCAAALVNGPPIPWKWLPSVVPAWVLLSRSVASMTMPPSSVCVLPVNE